MAASIEAYTVNDQSFDTEMFTIESVTQNTPLKRGDNLIPAMDHGLRFREKRMGGRTESWAMWICDVDPATGIPPSTKAARRAQFHENWDTVMAILMTNHAATGYDAPLKVVRTLKDNPSSPADMFRVNYGEVSGQINISDYRPNSYARFDVPILYMDPRWYEATSVAGNKATTTLTADGTVYGTAMITDMTITLGNGSVTNPYIENVTTGSKLTFAANPGAAVTINTKNYTVVDGSTNSVGYLDRTGSDTTDWFRLVPGANDFESNTTYSIAYTKAYI